MSEDWPEIDGAAREVRPREYWPLASEYLRNEKHRERWHVNRILWQGSTLYGSAALEGYGPSEADGDRFHLSIHSAREMEAQFAIIALHLYLRLEQKAAEVWMLRSVEECKAAIRDPSDVRFEIVMEVRRSASGKFLTSRHSRISDRQGGLFLVEVYGLMADPGGVSMPADG